MNFKEFSQLLKQTAAGWQADNAPRLAASLAYYALFSLAPAIIVAVAVAGLFLGQEAVEGRLFRQIEGAMGAQGAEAVQTLLASINQPGTNVIMAIVGTAIVFYGASNLFGQLGEALNTVWDVAPNPEQGVMAFIKNRLSAFAMVITVGLLLIISLLVSTAVTVIGEYFTHLTPRLAQYIPLLRLADLLLSFLLITLLAAAIYKLLPNVTIAWRDVWVGAAVTSLLFTVSKFLIGLYLGRAGIASAYGAAGSLIILMLWIYYGAQIFLFGAEFTYVYANTHGSHIQPSRYGVSVSRILGPVAAGETPAKPQPQDLARGEQRYGSGPPPASPLGPALRPYVESLPPVLRDQVFMPAHADYQVVLEGKLDQVWQRHGWLRPLFMLLERAGLLFAETGVDIPGEIVISAGREADGQPFHFWQRQFAFVSPRHLYSRLTYDPGLARPVEYFGPGGRLQMVWEVVFLAPRTLDFQAVECALFVGPWRLRLPAWSWFGVAFQTSAVANYDNQVRINLILTHPWLGEVFGYTGAFRQRLAAREGEQANALRH
jgi:membrane protein